MLADRENDSTRKSAANRLDPLPDRGPAPIAERLKPHAFACRAIGETEVGNNGGFSGKRAGLDEPTQRAGSDA